MKIRGKKIVEQFTRKHNGSRKPIMHWYRVASSSNWKNYDDLKQTFGTADLITKNKAKYVIFNIGGNNYRMITKIDFNGNLVIVKIMMTHAEYSKDKWKEML